MEKPIMKILISSESYKNIFANLRSIDCVQSFVSYKIESNHIIFSGTNGSVYCSHKIEFINESNNIDDINTSCVTGLFLVPPASRISFGSKVLIIITDNEITFDFLNGFSYTSTIKTSSNPALFATLDKIRKTILPDLVSGRGNKIKNDGACYAFNANFLKKCMVGMSGEVYFVCPPSIDRTGMYAKVNVVNPIDIRNCDIYILPKRYGNSKLFFDKFGN